jgi:hypothetical protein
LGRIWLGISGRLDSMIRRNFEIRMLNACTPIEPPISLDNGLVVE